MDGQVAELERFLRERYPDVVLIPTQSNKPGSDPSKSKQPLWCHRNVTTERLWQMWEKSGRSCCAAGLLMVLRGTPGKQLVVIDVDDKALADALVRRFPSMAATAIQGTRKGQHFLFHRTPACDVAGLRDCAGQIVPFPSDPTEFLLSPGQKALPIDVKTVTGGGSPELPTGGVLSVWPSPGKAWLTGSLFTTPPAPLPDDLLEFLVARHKTLSRVRTSKASGGGIRRNAVVAASSTNVGGSGVEPSPAASTASTAGVPSPPAGASAAVASPPDGADADVKALLNLIGKHRWDDRTEWMKIATALKNAGGDRDKALWVQMSRISAKFDADDAEKLWTTVATDPAYAGARLGLGSVHHMARRDNPHGYAVYRSSHVPAVVVEGWDKQDRGLADIAHDSLKGLIRLVGRAGDVYFFDEKDCRWLLGKEAAVRRMVSLALEEALRDIKLHSETLARAEVDEAGRLGLEKKVAAVAERIAYVRKTSGMANVTSVAIHMFRDDNFIHLLDSKPHLLGVKNGVVDLRTGELRARLPEDMIFTVIDVTFDPEASDALIRSTVLSAMADDAEMATYIQKLLGYGCTGEVCEEIFPVFTGSGRNCKGVLVKAVQDVLGDNFFRTMNNGIIVDKNVSNLDAERGNLLGTRFALFNELKDGDKLKTNEVQLLSGGDKIPATPKYKDPMNIEPHFLCLLTTNHMPELSVLIAAIMERMLCIHFQVFYTNLEPGEVPTLYRRQCDTDLKRRIGEDRVGVLRWLVDGAVAWYASKDLKRNAPAKVREFSRKYFEEQDRLAAFLRERCVLGDEHKVATSAFLAVYNGWAKDNGGSPLTEKAMPASMRAKGFQAKTARSKYGNKNSYIGVDILVDETDTTSASEARFKAAIEAASGIRFAKATGGALTWLQNPQTGQPMELDMYAADRRLAIEYDGPHHYVFPNMFHRSQEEFGRQQQRDADKDRLCAERGIKLIRVRASTLEDELASAMASMAF